MSYHSKLQSKLISITEIEKVANLWRFLSKKIVFTNGCFDILHAGHVDYLAQAKDLGSLLVVGLNTDSSVKRLGKSPERPINNEAARATVLAGLACIDAIVLFDEDTPYELIKLIQPHLLVKGGDYIPENIVGADIVTANGGKVISIPLVEGFSTTNIIEKIKH